MYSYDGKAEFVSWILILIYLIMMNYMITIIYSTSVL